MARVVATSARMVIVVFGCWATMIAWHAEAASQPVEWDFFQKVVFDKTDDLIRILRNGKAAVAEMAAIEEGVASLEALLADMMQQKQCPSQEACTSVRTIILTLQRLVKHVPGNPLSVDEERELASLRQASHNYYQNLTPPPAPAQATPAQPQKIAPPPTQAQSPFHFRLGYFFHAAGKRAFEPLPEGGLMHSGDHYKIMFTPSTDGYVYIFQMDSANEIYGLFPLKSFRGVTVNLKNPVKAGVTYVVPGEDKSFILDRQTGREQIYVLILPQPDPDLERQYQKVLQAQNLHDPERMQLAQAEFLKRLNTKGVAAVVQEQASAPEQPVQVQEDGQTFSLLSKRLQGNCQECVHVLTFQHQ